MVPLCNGGGVAETLKGSGSRARATIYRFERSVLLPISVVRGAVAGL